MRFQDTPIRRKLMVMILGTSGVVLVLTCAAFLGYEMVNFRQTALQQLATLGDIIAAESTAAVAFDNAEDATEVLRALKAERHIVAACIYDRQGKLFSRYPADAPETLFPGAPPREVDGEYQFTAGRLAGFTPIVQKKGSDRLGTLYLQSDLGALFERLRLYGVMALAIVAVTSLVAYILSRVLQEQVSRPVLALAETARAVSDRRDYSVRAHKLGDDEIGQLTDTFNHMLRQIQQQNAELERRVHERTAELEAANDELEAFCFSAAHDLRTPLRAMTGFAELLITHHGAALSPDVRRYVGLIHDGSHQMSQLINDLLEFSRLGRQQLARRKVDLQQLCRDVLRELEADRKDRRVECRLDALPPVYGDPSLLRVVLMNLLSNAFKYTRPRETARVEIGVLPGEPEGPPIFFVRDNGVGFDMRDASKLFGVFQRLHHAHEFEGTGVGLATTRRVITRHGGNIWFEAAPDAGATFYFTLPREDPTAGAEE